MRHRKVGKKFSTHTKGRAALLKSLAYSLVRDGAIVTTTTKAKELRRLADGLVMTAKDGTLSARRELHMFFGRRDVVNTLVDRVAPAMASRQSGFTTLQEVGLRSGDNTLMTKISWAVAPPSVGSLKNPTPVVHPGAKTKTAKPSKVKSSSKTPATKDKTPAKKAAEKPVKKAQ